MVIKWKWYKQNYNEMNPHFILDQCPGHTSVTPTFNPKYWLDLFIYHTPKANCKQKNYVSARNQGHEIALQVGG